ncbi:MAG: hypothetical protein Q4C77_14095 [Eubacteriales bacterium]|nr:hypothetical protein [Eubacteriales bacterium]
MNILDKEEFRIKLEEINHLVELKDYKGAMSVVDSIDWRRVKNVRTLCVVGEIYAANKRYEESKEIFLLAYHRSSIGKTILYRLIEVSLKMGDIEEAMEYYEEYTEVAPNDNMRYILKYKIYKAKKASLEELIQILEEYKEKEFTEKWSYELANLYYQAGEKEKCLDLCNQMVIWFSEGKYVMKALDLKLRLGSLTGEEKERYEQQFVPNLITPGEAKALKESTVQAANKEEKTDVPEKAVPPLEEEAPMIESIRMDEKDINNAESLQEKISKGIRDIFSGKKKEKEEDFEDAEEVQAKEEEVQEEMIKDISSKLDYVDVPELEPEGEDPEEKVPVNVSAEQKPDLSQTIQMPELKIPKSMKNMNRQETEIPKAPIIREDYIQNELPKKNLDDFDFNLEDTILAAATAQGIEIPDGPSSEGKEEEKDEILTDGYDTEKEETVQEKEVPEDQADETDIEEAAEKEPVTDRAEEPVPELEPEIETEPETEDDEEQQEEEQEPESEEEFEETDSIDDWDELEDMDEFEDEDESEARDDFDKDSVPSLEEEDFLSEEDLREAEEEFLNGPAKKTEPVPFKRKHPEGMNTEIFNFQEEIKKVLGDNESLFDDSFSNSGFNDQALSDSVFEEESDDVFIEEEKELKSAIKRVGEEEKLESPEPLTEEEELEQFIESIQPKNGRSPYDIVPRERELTDDEKKLFSYFVRVPGMKEQLIDALCDVQMAAADKTSRTGNVIVMGGRETGKTRLISSLIPAICKELNLEASKVAYVFADQINGKDMSRIVNKLAGGFLVIENANQLTQETAEQLDKAMEFRTDGLTVIVEDEKIGMRKFIARYPKLAKKFTSMINIPVFTNDELVSFAKVYTKENGYTIDQMGMLALYNMIGMNQKEDEPMNIGAVKNLVDAAIAKSQGGIRKLQRNISKKRTDHDGFIVLYEKDFS